jgi:hypothetical protein
MSVDRLPVEPESTLVTEPPQTMILYATKDAWRYVIYTDRSFYDGALPAWVTADVAQHEAETIANGVFGASYRLTWEVLDPGWWVARFHPGDGAS